MFGIILPIAMAALRLYTGKYIFSALTSLSSALVIVLFTKLPRRTPAGSVWFLVAGLVASVIGDWFLAHQHKVSDGFLLGVAGFFVAHALFIAYALPSVSWTKVGFALTAALLLGFGFYIFRCILPHVGKRLKLPVALYTLISIAGLCCAMLAHSLHGHGLYALGIACIVFSDCMIAESRFACHYGVQKLILPFYYLCHILLAASALV